MEKLERQLHEERVRVSDNANVFSIVFVLECVNVSL